MDPSSHPINHTDPTKPNYVPLSPFHAYTHRLQVARNRAAIAGQSSNQNPFNNHGYQSQPHPQPQTQTPQGAPHPSGNHPPYSQMIIAAIRALNEHDGSSKMAISRYIERSQPGLPATHGDLVTHHLKSLKNNGHIFMVRKSYKLAYPFPLENVGAASSGLGVARSEIPTGNAGLLDPVAVSASQPQKRGRGRPPKPRPQGQQQPIDVQPITVQSTELPVTRPTQEVTEPGKRRPGRPRKNGAAPIVQAATMAGIMKRRGRPPGRRAAGRQRKPKSVSATASVFPSYAANGARRRGRPRRVESGGTAAAPAGGEVAAAAVAVAPGMKRGRGRPPKVGGVMNRLITKPKRGRPAGRPRKNTTGAQEPAYGELQRKLDLFKEKGREILNGLKVGITSGDNQAVIQATQELEMLLPLLTAEPHSVEEEEVQPDGAAPQPQGEEEGRERGEQGQAQTQSEAEAMQEALF